MTTPRSPRHPLDLLAEAVKRVRPEDGTVVNGVTVNGDISEQAVRAVLEPVQALRALVQAEVQLALTSIGVGEAKFSAKRGAGALLLSKREAARRLGIDRNRGLRALIETGQLNVVKKNGADAVPAAEVERLAREGFDTVAVPRPRRRRSRVRTPMPSLPTPVSTWKLKL